jgi:polyisoprenoid-binding protein YceI
VSVQAFAGGLLSFVGHSPMFTADQLEGAIELDVSTMSQAALTLNIRADSLVLQGKHSASDRQEIETRMREEVLQVASFPQIQFESSGFAAQLHDGNEWDVKISGRLALCGNVRRIDVSGRLAVYRDGVRLVGATPLRMSEFGIQPVTALAGAIKLNDQLQVKFDLVGWNPQAAQEKS